MKRSRALADVVFWTASWVLVAAILILAFGPFMDGDDGRDDSPDPDSVPPRTDPAAKVFFRPRYEPEMTPPETQESRGTIEAAT